MSLSAEQKRLADKIVKLLAVASSTTFAAEAETARTMAEQLMKAHNISLGPGKPTQDTIEVRRFTPWAKGARWEGMIAIAITSLCSCQVFWDQGHTSYTFCGTIWNLDVVEYMVAEVNRQRMAAWMKYKGGGGADSFHKFCYGFASALQEKTAAMVPHNINATRKTLSLWYETNILHRKLDQEQLAMGRASSQAGLAAGKDASLHRGALGQPHLQVGYQRKLRGPS